MAPHRSLRKTSLPVRTWLHVALVAASLAVTALQAQPVFRVIGSDGKVTFSDRPAAVAAGNGSASSGGNAGTPRITSPPASAAAIAGLPFELRQVVQKYPVVLYTADNCGPCGAARSMLTSRGIPFGEKTVASSAETGALQRLSGDTSLPLLTIGSQQLKGYSDSEWSQFLDAAGYPKTSALPASYRAPAAEPMLAVAAAPTTALPASPASPASAAAGTEKAVRNRLPAPPPVAPSADNPTGIRF